MQDTSREVTKEGTPQEIKTKNIREGKYLTFSVI
jgi:hypothetical protein